jgi:endoglycosylceramidase
MRMPTEAGSGAPSPGPRRGPARRAGRGCLFSLGVLLLVIAITMAIPLDLHPRLSSSPRAAATAALPWLHTSGNRVVDENGRTVILRGYNVEALLEYPDHLSGPLDEQDAILMQSSGMNAVRLPLSWSLIEPTRGRFSADYLDRIVAAVQLLNRHGLYVIPDMHFYPNWGPAFGGAGAPSWAGFPGVPDIPDVKNGNIRKNFSPGANAASTYFWASDDWHKDFLLSWKAVADRLKDISGVAGYDLYNEPRPGPMPPPLFEKLWMWPLMSQTIESIGGVDPNHIFVVEATLFVDLPTWTIPIHAPNIVYSPHVYTGTLVPPDFAGDRTRLTSEMQQRQREADQMGAPLWVGEFGGDHNMPRGPAWADAMLDVSDDLGIGWAWWQWREQDNNWRIRSFDGQSYDKGFLQHMSRPFLAVAPDGVRGGRGDGQTGRIAITVAPTHGDGEAELAWSKLTLGTPRASGACISDSRFDEVRSRLVLRFVPGAACTVQVTA